MASDTNIVCFNLKNEKSHPDIPELAQYHAYGKQIHEIQILRGIAKSQDFSQLTRTLLKEQEKDLISKREVCEGIALSELIRIHMQYGLS